MVNISLIAALSENYVIGNKGTIPWHISEDFKLFKYYTSSKSVIMGRKTWDSLPRKPLPNRRNIVVSRNLSNVVGECECVSSLNKGIELVKDEDEVFIIGGEGLYKEALNIVDYMYLSHVKRTVEGDTFFPRFDKNNYKIIKEHNYDEFVFRIYERI